MTLSEATNRISEMVRSNQSSLKELSEIAASGYPLD